MVEAIHLRSRWRILDADALAAVKHRFRGARAAELFALVTVHEYQSRPDFLSNIKYVMVEELARLMILKVDRARSKLNVCER